MWNDLVQQRRHGDHCALGRQPEAAQGLEMLDRPHRCLPQALARVLKGSIPGDL
jgi:hypothetical protein